MVGNKKNPWTEQQL